MSFRSRVTYLYAIRQMELDGSVGQFVKIGFAVDPEARKMDCQIGNPQLLKLERCEAFRNLVSAREAEQMLHFQHTEDCIRGEWFKLTPRQIKDSFTAVCLKLSKTYEGPIRLIRPLARELA